MAVRPGSEAAAADGKCMRTEHVAAQPPLQHHGAVDFAQAEHGVFAENENVRCSGTAHAFHSASAAGGGMSAA